MTNKRKLQSGIALTAITSFLLMPINMACANTITAGNSGIGSVTNITNSGNTTNITSGHVSANGTGMNHFNKFDVAAGGTANLLGANRYINMVDSRVNIDGVLNAFTKGNLPANAMFVSPEGFAVGASGILNVGGLQVITPSQSAYSDLLDKAGRNGNPITLTPENFTGLVAGGEAGVDIDGKIYSAGNVEIKAGGDIFFGEKGLINTAVKVNDVIDFNDVSLFSNTGDIVGSNAININSTGNISLSAVNGGIGIGLNQNPASFGEQKSVTPFNVAFTDAAYEAGKKLNVEVASQIPNDSSFKGLAAIANHSTNLNVGTLKGGNVKITNKGFGTVSTTEAINDVSQLYLNAENGMLDIEHDINAGEIVRLSGKVGVEANANLNVSGNGYVSVYSEDGGIEMQDAFVQQGNIDIKAKNGDVTFGNLTIAQRGKYEDTLRLTDNQKLSTGIKAPDTFRDDGVHITSMNDNIIQNDGAKINSAGVVELIAAGGEITSTIKATDMIMATSGGKTTLTTEGTARLGKMNVGKLSIKGDSFLVDGVVSGSTVDIQAADTLTIRPKTYLDADHRTYGAIVGNGNVNINAKNGILATEQRPEGAMISSTMGKVNLVAANGDIKALGSDSPYITVNAADNFSASANNINAFLSNPSGGVGLVAAVNDANIGAVNDVVINNKITAGNDLTVAAGGNIKQNVAGASLVAGGDMDLSSTGANVGMADNYLTVELDGLLSASAPNGGVYINSANDSLNVLSVTAGKDVVLNAPQLITASEITAGKDLTLNASEDIVIASASVKGEVNAKAGNDIFIGAPVDMTLGKVEAGNDVTIVGAKNVFQGSNKPAIKAGNDLTISSTGADVGAANNYLTIDIGGLLDASAKGNVYIASTDDLNATVNAGGTAGLKTPGMLTISSATTGKDLKLESGSDIVANTKVGGELFAKAANNIDIDATGNLTLGGVEAGNNATIKGDAYIYQGSGKPAVKTGKNLTIKTTGKDIGASNKYLTVDIGGKLDAEAPGSIYIYGYGDMDVNKVEAGANVGLKTQGNLHQVDAYNPDKPSIIAGGNMTLGSENANVGDPSNPLSIVVPGQLDATAPKGGVYIGSKDNITIGQVKAVKDVSIESDGFIHQTDKGARPAIIAGEDLHLLSKTNNVGDPNNYLTVQVGDGLDAAAPQGGVYIYGYGDLRTDKVIAGEDIGIGGNKNIIIPHDSEEGNIIAGGNVKIEAGDSVLNGGGDGVGIIAGGDIDIIANLNKKDPAGSIGTLPYNDLHNSINVVLGGKVTADETGVDPANKVLNVVVLNAENSTIVPVDEDSIDVDDRDQRTLNVNNTNGNDGSANGVGHHRQDIRYNVVSNEYVLLSSESDSGAKVQNILNISKSGMLVKTNELPKVGENLKIQMDYKGLPFTVEGKVVRTDAAKGTAGIQFSNLDRTTASMLLYLGMRNGK